ncbi:phosphate acyltransferase PlsX [Desulfovibrio oxamicus]|uniref:Phosphate acyltransferase n=1 Tax=Nitratidesulfovibrio oxamicus TaxID=32016 RepID=A0ABS0JAF8_9BACT|nr:phosphate acyltransferase PlsX [Nitratidesulfovibrio oxamicus]MBG3878896.1 phosphate acyltransferase PlsX [Nitratidesulfovibrio oxamicus]
MSNATIIAVDAMGGDFGPSVVVPGAIEAARDKGIALLLVGDQAKVQAELARIPLDGVAYDVVHASEVAGMDEKPSDILRRRKDASIQVACRLVRDGQAHGIVSAGHSGATVACGMFIMGRIPGVDRPALATIMPTEKNPIVLLDVGANVDCKPHHLFQFGLMADAFARDLLSCESPRVGLLSIGEEEGKGNTQVKEAYELFKLAQNGINFVGNVEGRDIFSGEVDVVVCDGFVGNVALKLSEGLSTSLGRVLKRELLSGLLPKIGTLLAKSAFRRFAQFVDYAEYGGAPLLGLQGIAFVCHGKSNSKAVRSAVKLAATFVEKKTNERLIKAISANEELTRYGKAIK